MAYENGNGHANGNGNGRGRRTKWSPEKAEQILADLAAGMTRKAAAIRAGIGAATLCDWMAARPNFRNGVLKAEQDAYSDERAKLIETALQTGNSRPAACAYARIGPATFQTWLETVPGFAERIEQAEGAAEVGHVGNILKAAANGSWQASAWWLERRRNAEWGKRDHLEVEVKRQAEQIAAATGADPDWLLRRAEEIATAQLAAGNGEPSR